MKKVLKYLGISILVVLLFLVIAPFIFKDKLIAASKTFINEQLIADVDFDEDATSVSFLKSFPNVSFTLSKISIIGRDSFMGDTIAFLPELTSTLDIKSIFREEVQISKILLKEPLINIEVLRDETPNWLIWKTDTTVIDTAETKFALNLEEIEIEKGDITYKDYSLGFFTEILDLNHKASGAFTQESFTLKNDLRIGALTLEYGGVPWLYKAVASTKADVSMDLAKMIFNWNSDDIAVNDLKIHSDGMVQLNENDMDLDFKFNALENSFKSFLSMIPGMYQNNFKDLKANGSMSLKGSMIGKMTDDLMPKTNISLDVKQGAFSYPDLPRDVKDVFITASYSNKDGIPDHSIVDVSKFKANLGGDKVEGNLYLKTPSSNPYIDAKLKGKIDLSHVAKLVPLEKGTLLKGIVDADVMAKGHVESAGNHYQDLDAKGFLKGTGIEYNSPSMSNSTAVQSTSIEISPKYAVIENTKGHLGRNDFDISGRVENYLAFVFANETLKGNLDLKSNYLNANDFMSESETVAPKPSDTGNASLVILPENIDWLMTAQIKKLIYDNFILEDVGGKLHIADAAVEFNNVKATLASGSIVLDGKYDSKNIKNPFTEFKTELTKFDIAKSFEYFPSLRKFTNLASYVNGIFDAKIEMNSILDQNMQPNYNSMNVSAVVKLSNTFIKNFDVLEKAGNLLNINWLKNLKVEDKSLRFNINEGVLSMLDSVNLNLGKGAFMKLSGSSRLNKNIAYGGRMVIPRELFGKANDVLNTWKNLAAKKDWNLDIAKDIPVDINIGGTFLKPDVKVSLHSLKNSFIDPLKNQIIDKAKDEGNKKITEYLDKAQKQADRLKAEAKKRADQIREAGKKTADSIRNETARTTDRLRDEAKVRAYSLKQEGEKQKLAAIDKADKEVDELVARAEPQGPIAVIAAKKTGERIKKEAAKKAESIRAEYDSKVDDSNNKANQSIDRLQGEGNLRARKIEEEANERADKVESEAKSRADGLMAEAREKSKL